MKIIAMIRGLVDSFCEAASCYRQQVATEKYLKALVKQHEFCPVIELADCMDTIEERIKALEGKWNEMQLDSEARAEAMSKYFNDAQREKLEGASREESTMLSQEPLKGRYECICCHCGIHFDDDNKRAVCCPSCGQPPRETREKVWWCTNCKQVVTAFPPPIVRDWRPHWHIDCQADRPTIIWCEEPDESKEILQLRRELAMAKGTVAQFQLLYEDAADKCSSLIEGQETLKAELASANDVVSLLRLKIAEKPDCQDEVGSEHIIEDGECVRCGEPESEVMRLLDFAYDENYELRDVIVDQAIEISELRQKIKEAK